MNERRYAAAVEQLRAPQRVALLEIERVADLLLGDITAHTALDVGTGSGMFAEEFARRGLNVAGVDINPEMVEAARQYVWPYLDEAQGPPLAHRLKPEQVESFARQAGLKSVALLRLSHMVLYSYERQ